MYEHDVRWYALIPVAMIIALVQLFAEMSELYFAFPARPDWLWCLALAAALRTPPAPAILAFAVCGLVRDVFLGPKLGSAIMAYVAVGWLSHAWRFLAQRHNYAYQCLFAGVACFPMSLIKHSLDYGSLTYKLMDRVFVASLGDAVLTFAAFALMSLFLSFDSFRPWKEKSGF